jgi:phage tail sheath protein FI
MPVSPTYPGVYVQEVPSGVRTITSVSTSIAAFLGRTSKGPVDKAVRILSLADYDRWFGEPHPKSDLAQSVRQFFNNGGTDCYIVRLAPGATNASVNLHDIGGTPMLTAKAKYKGEWGNTIRLRVDYNTASPNDTFNLDVIYEDGGRVVQSERHTGLSMKPSSPRFAPKFVTDSSQLITLEVETAQQDPDDSSSVFNTTGVVTGFSNSRRPLRDPLNNPGGATDGAAMKAALESLFAAGMTSFAIAVDDSDYVTVDLSIPPALPATISGIQDNIAQKINNALDSLSPSPSVSVVLDAAITNFGRSLTILSDTSNKESVRVRRAAGNDIAAALMLGVEQGGIEVTRWSGHRPVPNASIYNAVLTTSPDDLTNVNELAMVTQSTITSLAINTTSVMVNTSAFNIVTTNGSDFWYQNESGKSSITGDNDGIREKLRIIANAINAQPELGFRAELWGYYLAIIATDGAINNQPSVVDSGTGEIDSDPAENTITLNIRQYSLGRDVGSFSSGSVSAIDGTFPDKSAYLGNESDQTGLHALDPVDLFNLLILPGDREVTDSVMTSVWGQASVYCQNHRAFLLIDPPGDWTDSSSRPAVIQDTSKINDLRATLVKDHSAVFYPRLSFSDRGVNRLIGPAGAIAGLMARTDSSRGVWKAPAGIEAGVRSINGVALSLTDDENGVLNKKGVNCIRVFPNGIVNWGSRTMDGDDDFGSEWKYIPVRRLALMIEESLYRGTKWVVFEPNDEDLWAKVRLNVGAYMMSLFRQGAFQGSDPKAAFYVKCDKDTTTQDDINKGIINIQVGFAPLKPAEFVVITIQQMAGEL